MGAPVPTGAAYRGECGQGDWKLRDEQCPSVPLLFEGMCLCGCNPVALGRWRCQPGLGLIWAVARELTLNLVDSLTPNRNVFNRVGLPEGPPPPSLSSPSRGGNAPLRV